jgi:hypothetical protein
MYYDGEEISHGGGGGWGGEACKMDGEIHFHLDWKWKK